VGVGVCTGVDGARGKWVGADVERAERGVPEGEAMGGAGVFDSLSSWKRW
jgi:hypothetical protein